MKRNLLPLFVCLCITQFSYSQNEDSSKVLSEVLVKAFEQNRQLKQTSAAVNFISPAQLQRFNNSSPLPAMNSTPGVRMEERSPGSYRMNIRGSTLRSPFGVRNVKIYFDEIPLTDAGGNTYLNALSFYNFNSIEVIKGPGGSLYGAGTGGVILIHSLPSVWQRGVDVALSGGSYGLLNSDIQVRTGNKVQNLLNFSHQSSDGYRRHTSMRRDIGNWQVKLLSTGKEELKLSAFYSDLYYQTPGALTKAEYFANPRSARPKSGTLPSADSAKAAIFQKTLLAGITNNYKFSSSLENHTTVFGAFAEIRNPTFRNYEKRQEPQAGARTVFKWNDRVGSSQLQFVLGSEAQSGHFNTKTFTNKNGSPATLQTNDDITPSIFSVFAQGDVQLKNDWTFTGGLSFNKASIKINRLSVANFKPVKREFKNELAPRLAISKRAFANLWFYASISKGFSPPTVAEVLPSTTVISTDLQAEEGNNYEGGFKSSWFKQRLYVEVNAFYYRLRNAIVQRKDSSNADYFTNAGSTKQRGIESQASYQLMQNNNSFLASAKIWLSHTWNKFNYDKFKQSLTDYSGKKMPSVAPQTVAAGVDLNLKKGIYLDVNYFYSDRIALNDANSDYASSYNLVGFKTGYKFPARKFIVEGFVGGENLFDVTYSLGNDINAAGGRYYNVAPGRSFYGGVVVRWAK